MPYIGFAHTLPLEKIFTPLFPDGEDQGDPFIFETPADADTRFRYYVITTAGGRRDSSGKVFSLFGTDDLIRYQKLERVLPVAQDLPHWAPAVVYSQNCKRPWKLVCSRGDSEAGNDDRNHRLFVFDALGPEGPYLQCFDEPLLSGTEFQDLRGAPVRTKNVFIIDPDLYRKADGTFRLLAALNYVSDYSTGGRIGTCLVEASLDAELSRATVPKVILRPSSDWQVYESERDISALEIDIPGHDKQLPVKWHCMEGPFSITEDLAGYAAGCWKSNYAVGLMGRDSSGTWHDLSSSYEDCLVRPDPALGLRAVGHPSIIRGPDRELYLMAHMNLGDGPRQFCLIPIAINGERVRAPSYREIYEANQK